MHYQKQYKWGKSLNNQMRSDISSLCCDDQQLRSSSQTENTSSGQLVDTIHSRHILQRRGTASIIVDTSRSRQRPRYSMSLVFSTCFRQSRSTYITNLQRYIHRHTPGSIILQTRTHTHIQLGCSHLSQQNLHQLLV